METILASLKDDTGSFRKVISLPVVGFFFVALMLVILACTYSPFYYTSVPFTPSNSSPIQHSPDFTELAQESNFTKEELESLYRVLDEACMKENRTVIIAPLNKAWADEGSIFDVFLQSFHEGEGTSYLLDHLVVIAFDEGAFQRCVQVHAHCFALKTPGVDYSQEQPYMSRDFITMSRRRVYIQITVLQLGFSFIFTDADILWFRPPFRHFSKNADFEISCDNFIGNSSSLENGPNTGLYHVHSKPQTIQFLKNWDKLNNASPDSKDQDVFYYMKDSPDFLTYSNGTIVKFMPTVHFGGLCQKSEDMEKVCTMHANCCVGLETKLADLKLMLDDWVQFKSMTPQESIENGVHFRAPQKCLGP